MSTSTSNKPSFAKQLLVLVSVVLTWGIVAYFSNFPDYILPSPKAVGLTFLTDGKIVFNQLGYSVLEWLIGMLVSIALAIVISLSQFYSRLIREFLSPVLVVSQAVPYLAIAPILMIWLGLGMTPKIVLVILSATFPIAISLMVGLDNARQDYKTLVSILNLSSLRTLFHIYIPAALPNFFDGLKISASYAFVTAVTSELIGSEHGLGVYIIKAQSSYRTDAVFSAVLVIIAVTLASTTIIDLLKRKVVFWESSF